ncbi:MAG: hypothetical protein AAGB34_01690 [Planctomycetota bacterium]
MCQNPIRTIAFVLISILPALVLSGCQSPIDRTIEEQDLLRFDSWITADTVGSVIVFRNGTEQTVASNTDCAVLTDPVTQRNQPIHLTKDIVPHDAWRRYSPRKVERLLAEMVEPGIDIFEALDFWSIHSVEIELIDPHLSRINHQEMERNIIRAIGRDPSSADSCLSLLEDPEAVWITEAFGARGVRIRFLKSDGSKVLLTRRVMERMGFSEGLIRRYEGSEFVTLTMPVYFAYRAAEVQYRHVFAHETPIRVQPIPRRILDTRRRASAGERDAYSRTQ